MTGKETYFLCNMPKLHGHRNSPRKLVVKSHLIISFSSVITKGAGFWLILDQQKEETEIRTQDTPHYTHVQEVGSVLSTVSITTHVR